MRIGLCRFVQRPFRPQSKESCDLRGQESPTMLPHLMDGLLWRSRVAGQGRRAAGWGVRSSPRADSGAAFFRPSRFAGPAMSDTFATQATFVEDDLFFRKYLKRENRNAEVVPFGTVLHVEKDNCNS